MGYNSTVVVMNDALHAIAEDKEFGKKLSDAVLRVSGHGSRPLQFRSDADVSAMSHVNAATVIETHHADGMNLIAVGGNAGYDFGHMGGYRAVEEELLRNWAHKLGYDLRKKPQR